MKMATTMETVITVLVLIAIITSAGSLWYGLSVAGDISKLTDSMADLAGEMGDLATSVSSVATSVSELATATAENLAAITGDLADITGDLSDIADRVTEIEATLTPTITVISGWAGAEMDAFLPVLERFETLSGINVKYTQTRAEDLAPILPAQFAAGTTPADVIFMWGWWIEEKGQEGHALEVTDLVDTTDFLPGAFDEVKVGNTIYGAPWTGKVKPGIWYRKSFFAANGLTVPTTWAEFATLLDDIAAIPGIIDPIASGDGVGWPLSDITEQFIITYGGPQLQRDLIAGTVDWTSPQVKTTVFEEKLVPTLGNFSDPIEWTAALDLWWEGDYGLYPMGSWITGMVDDPTDLGVFSLPGNDGIVFAIDYFFIPAYTKHPEEAKELFMFLASDEAQRLQVRAGGHIATNIDVSLDEYPAIDAMIAGLTTGKETLLDLDDAIGGEFQQTFWDQLKLLWVSPGELDNVLAAIEAVAP